MEKLPHDLLRSHVYDGIKEYDNPLPRWWLGLLYATIVFAGVYLIGLHFFSGHTIIDEYRDAMAANAHGGANASEAASELPLEKVLHDAASIAAGKETFGQNCMPCHGANGEGNIGPNLTDEYWLHGGKPESILKTVSDGVPEKGMPAWKPVLGEKKVVQLVAFILSLQGTHPANAKAPQGDLEKP